MKFFKNKPNFSPVFSYPVSEEPSLYDSEGNRRRVFYLRDNLMAPYSNSKYFEWDRINYGLKTHFYTQHHMNELIGNPDHRYGMLVESRAIVPDNYRMFKRFPGLSKEFDAIFTYDEELLNTLPNAVFYPYCAYVWYKERYGHNWDSEQYKKKTKDISIVSSDKDMCYMHRVRMKIARKCRNDKLADLYGTIDGGSQINIDDTLEKYRYSIVIENDISDYFFTERITNCFAAQVIPIYIGARKISDFFNKEGIIYIDEGKIESIYDVLGECTKELYESKTKAILDNFDRAKKYVNIFDLLYENNQIQ